MQITATGTQPYQLFDSSHAMYDKEFVDDTTSEASGKNNGSGVPCEPVDIDSNNGGDTGSLVTGTQTDNHIPRSLPINIYPEDAILVKQFLQRRNPDRPVFDVEIDRVVAEHKEVNANIKSAREYEEELITRRFFDRFRIML